ncbi:MAG: hypothetical protein WBW55_04645 [Desulfobaccales bacterium]
MTENIDNLQEVFTAIRRRRPFTIEAIVILPVTCIASGLYLPGMRISPHAGMISKHDLPHKFPEGKDFHHGACRRENGVFGSGAFGNTSSVMRVIMSVM